MPGQALVPLLRLRQRDQVVAVAIQPGGELLATSGNDAMQRWRTRDGALVPAMGETEELSWWGTCLGWSAGHGLLAGGGVDGRISLWDGGSGRLLRHLRGHSAAPMAVAFSPDGALLASSGLDLAIRLWSVPEGAPLALLSGPHLNDVMALAFSPDGLRLASGSMDEGPASAGLCVWDLARGAPTWSRRAGAVHALAWSASGSRLFVGGDAGALTCLDAEGTPRWRVEAGRCAVYALAALTDERVAAGDGEGLLTLWDGHGRPLSAQRAHEGRIYALDAAADGGTLASGSADRTAATWQVPPG